MESDSLTDLLIFTVSLLLYLLTAVLDTSISSIGRRRIQLFLEEGFSGSKSLNFIAGRSAGFLDGFSVLKTAFLSVGLVSLTHLIVVNDWQYLFLIGVLLLTIVVVLGLSRVISKFLSDLFGERIGLIVSFPLWILVFCPLIWIENVIRQVFRMKPDTKNTGDSVREELGLSVNSDGEPLDEREVRMIKGVVELDKTTAREIMLPRVDMVAVEYGIPLDELADEMVNSGHSRIPVYQDDLDNVKGIAYARDILGFLSSDQRNNNVLTTEIIRQALFIPESKTLEELLNEFQERQVHIAIVVDEYGGVAGLVTIEDLLEEIVGEIRDEFDVGESEIEPLGGNEFLLDARVGIDELNELMNVNVESDGFDTVGGFVYHRLGKLPSSGDLLEYDGLTIKVISTIGRRLKKLRVKKVEIDV